MVRVFENIVTQKGTYHRLFRFLNVLRQSRSQFSTQTASEKRSLQIAGSDVVKCLDKLRRNKHL